jgi:hypothetical protein
LRSSAARSSSKVETLLEELAADEGLFGLFDESEFVLEVIRDRGK